jgi:aspartate aminotransferase
MHSDERIGNLTITVQSPKYLPALQSKIARAIYSTWSNPPAHGARIVHRILTCPELKLEWLDNLKTMAERVKSMRAALRSHLEQLKTPGDWGHITQQTGMFSYTGLSGAVLTTSKEY